MKVALSIAARALGACFVVAITAAGAQQFSPEGLCDLDGAPVAECVRLMRESQAADVEESRRQDLRRQANEAWKAVRDEKNRPPPRKERSFLNVESTKYRPDGQYRRQEHSVGSRVLSVSAWQEGTANGRKYTIFDDGSGSLAKWSRSCRQDKIDDRRTCLVYSGDLYVHTSAAGVEAVSVGADHFPGSTVALRIDRSPAVDGPANGWGKAASRDLVRRMTNAQSVVTRHMKWPHRIWIDTEISTEALQDAIEIAVWACAQR